MGQLIELMNFLLQGWFNFILFIVVVCFITFCLTFVLTSFANTFKPVNISFITNNRENKENN